MKEKFENKESSLYQELYDLLEIKIGGYTLENIRESFKEGGIINFVLTRDLNIYLSGCIPHYEICQQNGLEALVDYGSFYRNSQGEEIFSLINYPSYTFPSHAFKKYLPVLGENAIKNIIKNKIKSLLTSQ